MPSVLLLPRLSIPSRSLSVMSEPLTLLSSTLETVHLTCLHLCSLLQSTGYVLSLFPCLFQFSILPLTCLSLYSLPTAYTSSISQIILFNTLSFYLKQTTHFIVHRFFTHFIFSYTVITLPIDSIVSLVRPNDWSYLLLIQFNTLHLR